MTRSNGHHVRIPAPAYIERAIAEECTAVENAAPSTANATLHKAAVSLGTMSGAGWLDRSAAEAALQNAAAKRCNDQSEARRTIESGLNWGEQRPRDLPSSAPHARKPKGRVKDDKQRAHQVFATAEPIAGTLAERYLAARKIAQPLPSALRFAPAIDMPGNGKHPAMLAAVVIPTTGQLIAVQRTAIAPDGSDKAAIEPKKASIGSTSGGAVVLGDITGAEIVLEGEGVETVLSACQAIGLPGIATLSAGTLGKPSLPSGCGVIILGDRGSEEDAEAGAQRRHEEGRIVRIAYPPEGSGKDFNDQLKTGGTEAVKAAIEAAGEFAPATAPRTYSARCLADVDPKPVRWLWKNRIARGKLNLLAGHPGRGKSTLTLHMASVVSAGGGWPDGAECPLGNVIFITCEDDAADTLVPRLKAAGADCTRCHLLDTVQNVKGGWRPFNLKTDIANLEQMACDIGSVSLVVIDPISAYLDGIDSHKVAEVRGGLVPLQQFAERSGAAVILVSHFNKGTPDGSAMSRVAGSGAFVAVCRSAWAVERDPEQPDGGRRILAPMKNNLGDDRTGFAFELEPCEFGDGTSGSRVRFLPGTISISADELVRSHPPSNSRRSALSDASEFLSRLLASGPLPEPDIKSAATKAGQSWRTIQRAKKTLAIGSVRRGDHWDWELAREPLDHPELFGDQDRQGRQERQHFTAEDSGGLACPDASTSHVLQGRQIQPSDKIGGLGGVGGLDGGMPQEPAT